MTTVSKLTEGAKFDGDKLRMDLIPPEAVEALAQVLTFGAKKYADRNWEKGIKWGRVFGAAMRHLWAWWRGDSLDKETGYSHLWHALTCIAFLLTYEARKMETFDDRPGTTNHRTLVDSVYSVGRQEVTVCSDERASAVSGVFCSEKKVV